MPELIVSLAEARARGLTRYFTGKPCKHGHIAERLVSNRRCNVCVQLDRTQWGKDNPDKLSLREARYYVERLGCRAVKIANAARWAEANPGARSEITARYRSNNPEKCVAASKRSEAKKPDYYRGLHTAQKDFRRARMANLPWADRQAITAFWIACPPGMTVDHIVPLAPKRAALTAEGYRISGLHVVWNLQYLPRAENVRKGARMRPEDQALCEWGAVSARCGAASARVAGRPGTVFIGRVGTGSAVVNVARPNAVSIVQPTTQLRSVGFHAEA
jgi:hypothetical protein